MGIIHKSNLLFSWVALLASLAGGCSNLMSAKTTFSKTFTGLTSSATSVSPIVNVAPSGVPSSPPVQANPANSFYVSPTGDDTHDGKTAQTAWKTVAKVNSSTFSPGAFVLFQRNGVWRESLQIPSSGTAANPITFADYGDQTGAKPRFLGSIVLSNSQFQPAGNGIYTIAVPSEVFSVLANQIFLLFPQGQPAQSLAGSWSYANNVLTINSPSSDPRVNGQTYEAVVREDVIWSNAQSHLVIQNLVADETAHYNGGYAFRIEQSQDVTLNGCEAYRAGKHHFGVINTTGFVGENLYSAYAMPGQHWQPGDSASAYVSYGDNTGVSNQTSQWNNTVFEHPEDVQAPGNNYYVFITHGANIGSVMINNMVSQQANLSLSNGDNNQATVQLKGGLINNARLEVDGNGVVVDGIHISGPQATVDLIGTNITLQNSLIEGTNLGSAWYQTAIAARATGDIIRFNTVVLDPTAPSGNTCVTAVSKGIALHMVANIFIANGRVFQLFDSTATGLDSSTIAESHDNLYPLNATFAYNNSSWQFTDETLVQWKASGFDQRSVAGDPLFVNRANGNFNLGAGSPALDAVPLSAISGQVLTDFSGNPRSKNSAYDIGAFEN